MINYHHIGGRNGTYPLPLKNGPLLNNFHLVLYDADANCFEQMGKAKEGDWGKTSVFPCCIGGKKERAPFRLNFHPTTNSLYPFNNTYADYGFVSNPLYGEYRLGDACRTLDTIHLDLHTLDEVLDTANISTIDFLSLDVQGAEFDILQGARTRLQRECVGIELEVEFVELYSGQKTFFEIQSLLDSMGFELIEIESFGRCAPISLPIGYRGNEQPMSAEGIYVKKLDELVKMGNADLICKAAFFNLLYKKMGLCIKYLDKVVEIAGEAYFNSTELPLYQHLLSQIWSLYKKDKQYTFPSISQLFSNQAFQQFYRQGKSSPVLADESLIMKVNDLKAHVKTSEQSDYSPLELLLKQYELNDVAETVRQNRLSEAECLMQLERHILNNQMTLSKPDTSRVA